MRLVSEHLNDESSQTLLPEINTKKNLRDSGCAID